MLIYKKGKPLHYSLGTHMILNLYALIDLIYLIEGVKKEVCSSYFTVP